MSNLARRHRAEKRFALYGLLALCFSVGMLAVLLATLLGPAWDGLHRSEVRLAAQAGTSPDKAVREAFLSLLPEAGENRRTRRDALTLLSSAAGEYAAGSKQGVWVPLADAADLYYK